MLKMIRDSGSHYFLAFFCDTCKKEIESISDGLVTWHFDRISTIPRVIHKGDCDNDPSAASEALEDCVIGLCKTRAERNCDLTHWKATKV